MKSFERINYSLRANKHVERRLMFEAFQTMEPEFGISAYRYIGLGSMWFADFTLAHKVLGITDLSSIEAEKLDADRARFNRPFDPVVVVDGETTLVLPDMQLDQKRAIVWLDYDGVIASSTLSDIAELSAKLSSGSIALVTLNSQVPRGSQEAKEAVIRPILGTLIPQTLPSTFFDQTPEAYPASLATALFDQFATSLIDAGRTDVTFVPMFNFFYADSAPMITVGGMIADETDQQRFKAWYDRTKLEAVSGRSQYLIRVPHLTPREKLAIDQMMPCLPENISDELAKRGLPFDATAVRDYSRFYPYYPLYAEFSP